MEDKQELAPAESGRGGDGVGVGVCRLAGAYARKHVGADGRVVHVCTNGDATQQCDYVEGERVAHRVYNGLRRSAYVVVQNGKGTHRCRGLV